MLDIDIHFVRLVVKQMMIIMILLRFFGTQHCNRVQKKLNVWYKRSISNGLLTAAIYFAARCRFTPVPLMSFFLFVSV